MAGQDIQKLITPKDTFVKEELMTVDEFWKVAILWNKSWDANFPQRKSFIILIWMKRIIWKIVPTIFFVKIIATICLSTIHFPM